MYTYQCLVGLVPAKSRPKNRSWPVHCLTCPTPMFQLPQLQLQLQLCPPCASSLRLTLRERERESPSSSSDIPPKCDVSHIVKRGQGRGICGTKSRPFRPSCFLSFTSVALLVASPSTGVPGGAPETSTPSARARDAPETKRELVESSPLSCKTATAARASGESPPAQLLARQRETSCACPDMTESVPGRGGPTQEAQCYNCGSLGHWAVACPEPTRETPA